MFAVVNSLRLSVPVEEILPAAQNEFPPAFAKLKGFRSFQIVKAGPQHAIVILLWDTGEDAAAASGAIGPTLFAKHIIPYLAADQDRAMGPVVVSSGPESGSAGG
ncbi:MAG: hypothetical protein U0556_13370 [Dehalococcoidia bacterium]